MKELCIIRVPIYRTRVYVLDVADDPKEALKDTDADERSIGKTTKYVIAECVQIKQKSGAMSIILRLGKYSEYDLWHEAIHVAAMIIDNVGLDPSEEHCEGITYLTEWIVKMVKSEYYKQKVEFYD